MPRNFPCMCGATLRLQFYCASCPLRCISMSRNSLRYFSVLCSNKVQLLMKSRVGPCFPSPNNAGLDLTGARARRRWKSARCADHRTAACRSLWRTAAASRQRPRSLTPHRPALRVPRALDEHRWRFWRQLRLLWPHSSTSRPLRSARARRLEPADGGDGGGRRAHLQPRRRHLQHLRP